MPSNINNNPIQKNLKQNLPNSGSRTLISSTKKPEGGSTEAALIKKLNSTGISIFGIFKKNIYGFGNDVHYLLQVNPKGEVVRFFFRTPEALYNHIQITTGLTKNDVQLFSTIRDASAEAKYPVIHRLDRYSYISFKNKTNINQSWQLVTVSATNGNLEWTGEDNEKIKKTNPKLHNAINIYTKTPSEENKENILRIIYNKK